VHPAVVERNLSEHLPFMATETLLMQATAGGGDRQELHERIRVHAHAAASEMKAGRPSDLVTRIAADHAFGMDADRIRGLIEASSFVGRAPEQVDRFLGTAVDPILERLGHAARERLGDPDVRV
jgi:adenylosuccinate lyase